MITSPYLPVKPRRKPRQYDPITPVTGTFDVGYIRRSGETEANLSEPAQERDIGKMRMAYFDSDVPLRTVVDMGKSGREEKTYLRDEYNQIIEWIEAGAVRTVFAAKLDRLGRSVVEGTRLIKIASAHGVRVWTGDHGEISPTGNGKLIFQILMACAEWEAEKGIERARDIAAFRRSRGDIMGHVDYGWKVDPMDRTKLVRRDDEPLELVLETYRRVKTVNGTVRELNRMGVPTRRGKPWAGTSLRGIINRTIPEEAPAVVKRGVKHAAPFVFFQLLRCGGTVTDRQGTHRCNQPLTGLRARTGPATDFVRYVCSRAQGNPHHSSQIKSIAERKLLPWAQVEAQRWLDANRGDVDELEAAENFEAERRQLEDQRESLGDAFVAGAYGDPKTPAAKAKLAAKLAAIEDRLTQVNQKLRFAIRTVASEIDWSKDAEVVNHVLRAMWASVELDDGLLPVTAVGQPGVQAPPPSRPARGSAAA